MALWKSFVGVLIALFGFELQTRLARVFDRPAVGIGRHARKWLPAALIVLFVLLVEGRSLASIGWRIGNPLRLAFRIALGLAIMLGANIVLSPVWSRVGDGGAEMRSELGSFAEFSIPERLFIALTAGVTEEVTFRGYAIERLIELTGNPLLAGGFSFGVFTLTHYGETWSRWSVIRIAQPALITTALYLWFRSLPVLIVIHTLNDAIGLLMAGQFVEEGESETESS